MKSLKDFLNDFRQFGLDTTGELSVENIVYKILRSKGVIKKLKDAIVQVYDKQMTVPEVAQKDIKSHHPTPFMPQHDNGEPNMNMMTLDNLKSLREKAGREWDYYRAKGLPAEAKNALERHNMFHTEIQSRLAAINAPMEEGYGMGKPENDPKAKGRWTVDFESSNKFPR
jgi:hypothetical protein